MRRASIAALALTALLAIASGCDGLRNEAETRQCRANMNLLSTEQALSRTTYGRWASSIAELDRISGRTVPLACPVDGNGYVMEAGGDGYTVTCPCGEHGSIETGSPSWTAGGSIGGGGGG
jgi:hypothetical protein